MRVEIRQNLDETGAPEEFTWDLYPIVDSSETTHLDEFGLPKTGTQIHAGMILVGIIARTTLYDPNNQPTALDKQWFDREYVNLKYGKMWNNKSFYADDTKLGSVQESFFFMMAKPRLLSL